MATREKLEGLEALRWFAAASIITYHVATIPTTTPSTSALAHIEFLSFGVPLFYVVSSFGLWYGYTGRLSTMVEVRHFYRRRFFRIAPLFYVMLAIYAALLGFNVSLAKLATSLTFTFNLVPTHVEGIVWASWSVGVEMLFYAIMPALALVATDLKRAVALFVSTVALAFAWNRSFEQSSSTLQTFAFFSLANFLYFFAAGVVALLCFVHLRERDPLTLRRVGLYMLAAAAVAAVALVFMDPDQTVVRVAWSVALACITLGVSATPVRILVNRVTRRLGEASFSLYLLHPPLIGLLDRTGVVDALYAIAGPFGYALAVLLTFAIVIPASLLSYKFIEIPGIRLGGRGALARRTSVRPTAEVQN